MNAPENARNALRAVMNQLPITMEASLVVLDQMARSESMLGDNGEISAEKLHHLITKWVATLADCMITSENRLERTESRRGIPDLALGLIMGEFGTGDG
jgi:hypothetical protein